MLQQWGSMCLQVQPANAFYGRGSNQVFDSLTFDFHSFLDLILGFCSDCQPDAATVKNNVLPRNHSYGTKMEIGPMANLCDEFELFNERITLTPCKQTALGIARDSIHQRIQRYFRQTLNVQVPKFWSQGAYAANIAVGPVDGEHHIEEGVYLQHLDRGNIDCWPSADAVQQVLVDATQGRTVVDLDGNPVRVRIRPAQGLCMDLFCYADLNGKYYQAIKGKTNWLGTHPLAATGWFKSYINQRGEQLRRIVRYFIAWAGFQFTCRGIMPDIMMLTVLATYNFNDDYRDDVALARTFEAVSNYVRPIVYVLNPININEELSARLTESQKSRFQETVDEAANIASAAIVINDAHMASRLWRKLLGTRFPLPQENIRTELAAIQTPAAPWRLRRMCTWLQGDDR
jgi:hypothetical protein